MRYLALVVILATVLILPLSSCGDNSVYDQQITELRAELEQANTKIAELQDKALDYFPDRETLEVWLDTVPSPGVREISSNWYSFGLYHQEKALQDGYIISVSFDEYEGYLITWCNVLTKDGNIYFFDPQNAKGSLSQIKGVDIDVPKFH